MPWDLLCPFGIAEHHTVPDAFAELFEPPDSLQISRGQAAMPCPVCGKPWRFPRGWLSNPVQGEDLPVVYWSRRIWNSYTDARKDEVRQRVPNVERYLR